MDLKGVEPHTILSNLACIDDKNQESCNAFSPLPQYKLYGKNPATNKTFTDDHRVNKLREFENKCSLNNNKVTTCCSPDDTNLGFMADFVKMDVKDKKVRLDEKGNYFICSENSNNPDCKRPSGYDLCKLSSPELTLTTLSNGEQRVYGATPDCFKGVCASVHDLGYLEDEEMKQFYSLQDSEILTAIQKNNAEQIKDILKDSNRISRPLSVGYEGNTMLHHAVLYDANEIIMLLLSRKVPLDVKNKDGNTPLHLAALKGNSAILNQMIEMGGDTEIVNNLGDTVLLSAIRSADYPTVHVVLQLASATPISRNKLGETPLHIALISPQKNVDIVRLLINKGVDLYEKNNNGHTALKTLELQRRTKQNEEIRTYLINVIIKKEGNNFIKQVKKFPELANFEVVNSEGMPINLKYIEGLEGVVVVSLPEQYLPDNLQFTEDKQFKYKELTEEEKIQGDITNPLNDVNYFDRGAPNNIIEGSSSIYNSSGKHDNDIKEHTHFSKENRAILNDLIKGRKKTEEDNSIMGKIQKTLQDTGYTPYNNNKSSNTKPSKNNNNLKKTEQELATLKAQVELAKKEEQEKLKKLQDQKQQLLDELEQEQNKSTLSKLFGGDNTENIQFQINVINENITNITNSVIAGGDSAGGNINKSVKTTTTVGDGGIMATNGSTVNINKSEKTTTVGDVDVTMLNTSTTVGDVDVTMLNTSTTVGDVDVTMLNKSIKQSTTVGDVDVDVIALMNNKGQPNTLETELPPETVEAFTIIPKSQNRFYLFAVIVLILFLLIAILNAKKLI